MHEDESEDCINLTDEVFLMTADAKVITIFYTEISKRYIIRTSFLPISGFVLDEKFQRNASKFAISNNF